MTLAQQFLAGQLAGAEACFPTCLGGTIDARTDALRQMVTGRWHAGVSALHQAQHAVDLAQPGPKFHVVLSTENTLYQQWQVRVYYYHYRKIRAQHPESAVGGFTRLLHT